MGLRSSLTVIAIGAILAFAVRVDFQGLDVQVVGYILMLTGLIGMALTFSLRRRRAAAEAEAALDPETRWNAEPESVHFDRDHDGS